MKQKKFKPEHAKGASDRQKQIDRMNEQIKTMKIMVKLMKELQLYIKKVERKNGK